MEPLVTPDQLASRLHSTVDPDSAALAVTNASGLVRGVARQAFSFVTGDTVELEGGGDVLTLPERPVVVDASNPLTVVEVGEYGDSDFIALENRDFARSGNELRRGYPAFYRTRSRLQGWPYNRYSGLWALKVRVTYSHGYLTMPDEIAAVVLDVAQSLYSNPQGLRSFTTPEYSETYATELLGAATVESIRARLGILGYGKKAFSIRTV